MISIKIIIQGELVNLDLTDNISVTIKETALDFRALTSSKIMHTFPINFPKTSTNTKFFNSLSNIDAVDSLTYSKNTCYVFVDSILIMKGYIQQNSYTNNMYSATIYNENVEVFDIIKNTKLNALDFNSANYVIDALTVKSDFERDLNAVDQIHRHIMADVGQGFGLYNEEKTDTISMLTVDANTALDVTKINPAQDVKKVYEKIKTFLIANSNNQLTDVNFPILENEDYDRLFILNAKKPEPTSITTLDLSSFYTSFYSESNEASDYPLVLEKTNQGVMVGGGKIVIPAAGTYRVQFYVRRLSGSAPAYHDVFLQLKWAGGQTPPITILLNEYTYYDYNFTFAGPVEMEMFFNIIDNTPDDYNFPTHILFEIYGNVSLPAGSVVITEVNFAKIWEDYTFYDFLKIFIELFNLRLSFDGETLNILTYDDFYNQTHNVIDITDRIIKDGLKVETLSKELPKKIEFLFDESEDLTQLEYYKILDSKIGGGIFYSNIPFLEKDFLVNPKSRLFYRDFIQKSTRGSAFVQQAKGLRFISSEQDFSENGLSGIYVMYRNKATSSSSYRITDNLSTYDTLKYPQFSAYKQDFNSTEISTTDPSLQYFFTPPPNGVETFASGYDVEVANTLYNAYYKNMIEEMFDITSKYVYCQLHMDIIEHLSIKMWDRLKINNSVFKIVESTYNIQKKLKTFKLIKTNN